MATTPNSIITVQTPKLDLLLLTTSDSTGTNKTFVTGGSNGTKISGIWASNTDGLAHNISMVLQRSGGNYTGVTLTIPASAGFGLSIPSVNLMSPTVWPGLPLDSDGNPFFFLQSSLDTVAVNYSTGLSAGQYMAFGAVRGDF